MRALRLVLFSALFSGVARADRVPVAVLWLDGSPGAAADVERGLAASSVVRPIDDAEARRVLVEGGPRSLIAARVASAQVDFSAGRCADADAALAEAEAGALVELPVADTLIALGEIEPQRLLCADLSRDDAAAVHAVRLLALSGVAPSPAVAAAMARHPLPPLATAPPARVESEPPGALVYLDLRAIGPTPIDLPAERRDGALIDLELAGFRKVHRTAPLSGTLAAALSRDDRLGPLVDRVRAAKGDAPEADVAALGRRVGAARLVVARLEPGSARAVQARVLDVATAKWARAAITVPLAEVAARLAAYAGPPLDAPKAIAPTAATPSKEGGFLKMDTSLPAWKRWYTWVAGGVLLVAVVALVVAYHVGSDQVTIDAMH